MGKDWDKTLPPRAAFEEIIRVLKPGALAFVMSSPRQDLLWRMLAMLEGVGFELTQSTLFHIYKTGFPKAYDCAKGFLAKSLQALLQDVHHLKDTIQGSQGDCLSRCRFCDELLHSFQVVFREDVQSIIDVPKHSHLSSPSIEIREGNGHKHRVSYDELFFLLSKQDSETPSSFWKGLVFQIRSNALLGASTLLSTIFPSIFLTVPDIDTDLNNKNSFDHEPKPSEVYKLFHIQHRFSESDDLLTGKILNNIDALIGREELLSLSHSIYKSLQPYIHLVKGCPNCLIKFLETSMRWQGYKAQTGLKPAYEPILMVNKPFSESTIVDNVLRWGTGAINVDATRIPVLSGDRHEYGISGDEGDPTVNAYGKYNRVEYEQHNKGRFPANMLVTDKALDLVGRQDEGRGHTPKRGDTGGLYEGGFGVIVREEQHFKDSGGLSRFFDLDAWAKHHGFLDVPKPDNKERDFGLKGKKRIPTSKLNLSGGKNPVRLDGVISKPRRNIHPTVKPIKLMAYLIELGCPSGGVVLDPFVGTGTTCIAAKQLVRRFIGIEINPEYHALAVARVAAHPVPLSWL